MIASDCGSNRSVQHHLIRGASSLPTQQQAASLPDRDHRATVLSSLVTLVLRLLTMHSRLSSLLTSTYSAFAQARCFEVGDDDDII
jgi:hypothetical protein